MTSVTRDSVRTELILSNRLTALKITRSLCRQWNAPLNLDEMQSAADRALCEAARGFDPDRGVIFVTYLFPFIKSAVVSDLKFRRRDAVFSVHTLTAESTSTSHESEGSGVEDLAVDECDSPEGAVYRKQLQALCMRALNRLQPLERTVLVEAYMLEQTVTHIARKTGYSRPYLSSIRSRAIRKMQPYLEKEAA